MEPNLALPGQSSPLARIHETSAKFQRYRILLRRRWWFLLLTASIGVCVQALRITGKPQNYISLAKLVAGGHMVVGGSTVGYQEYLSDFYGTIIETLESSEMRRHAVEGVHALYPDLKEADVDVRVNQNKGSAIFNVAAVGSDREYVKTFLNALLDEFKAFREMNHEQQRNKAVQALAEDLAKSEKEMRDNAGKLADFKKNTNIVVISQNQAADMLRQYANERERLRVQASEAELALKDVGRVVMAKKAFVARQRSNGGGDDEAAQGLTKAEMDYLNTRSELAVWQVDLETLRETNKSDSLPVQEAEQHQARLEKLLKVYVQQITEIIQTQKDDTERRLSMVELKEKDLSQTSLEIGSKLAEHARLQKACETSDATHKEVLDLMHKFQVNEEMTGDYVSIMERASTAVEDVRPWWRF